MMSLDDDDDGLPCVKVVFFAAERSEQPTEYYKLRVLRAYTHPRHRYHRPLFLSSSFRLAQRMTVLAASERERKLVPASFGQLPSHLQAQCMMPGEGDGEGEIVFTHESCKSSCMSLAFGCWMDGWMDRRDPCLFSIVVLAVLLPPPLSAAPCAQSPACVFRGVKLGDEALW